MRLFRKIGRTTDDVVLPIFYFVDKSSALLIGYNLNTVAEGKRSALPHSRVMIHQPMGGAQGQASDIEITAREIQKLKKELYTIIADHSHTDFDKVWADSDRDYWMTAQEAKEYGMIDEVLIKK